MESFRDDQRTWPSIGGERAEDAFQALVEQIPGAICRFDVRQRVMLYVSPQIESLTGEPVSAWLGAEGYARWSASMIDASQPDWEELARRGAGWQNQYQWRRSDGAVRWFRSITKIVAPDVVQSLVLDATEEVEQLSRLTLAQHRYQALVEQMPVLTLVADADGRVEYVSPQIEEWFGDPAPDAIEELNSDHWLDAIHPDDRTRAAAFFRPAPMESGDVREMELRARTRAGSYRDLLVRRSRVELPAPVDGHYYQSVVIDITDLRAAENRSRAALAALVHAGEDERARLAVELHDDTIQAMTAVLLQLHRLRSDDHTVADAISILEGAINRTRHLMFEVRPALLEREGLAAIIRRIAEDGPWSDTRVDITISRQSDTVEALCYRTLRELILNARKHSNATTLTVRGSEADGTLTLAVGDNGIGFDPEQALDQQAHPYHLGLASVVERVRLAGGDVHITSSPGAGAEVTIELPAQPRLTADKPGGAAGAAPPG